MIKKMLTLLFFLLSVNIPNFSQGYICAVGGGSEDYGKWSDAPYSWIVDKSDNGKILIIYYDASYNSSWYQNYFESLGASSTEFLAITNSSQANTDEVYLKIKTAKGIFFPGGDQWQYVKNLKGTKAALAIKEVYDNGGVVGGTSAGCAILSDVVFTAEYGSAYSDVALRNPFYSKMTLDSDVLNLLPGFIFDTHYTERARFGRLLMFMYQVYHNYMEFEVFFGDGIGIDDKTALCIEPNGDAMVHGTGTVEIFYHDQPVDAYDPFEHDDYDADRFTIHGMKTAKLTDGWGINIYTKELINIPESAIVFEQRPPQDPSWRLPKTSFITTANNNFSSYKSSLDTALVLSNAADIVILTDGQTNENSLENYLNQLDQSYSKIEISEISLDNSEYQSALLNSELIIFSGEDLNKLSLIRNKSTLLGNTFANKISEKTFLFFIGKAGKLVGSYFVNNTDNNYLAAYKGLLQLKEGLGVFEQLTFQPELFDADDFAENRTTAVTWGMMRSRGLFGIYSYADQNLYFDADKYTVEIIGESQNPLIVVSNLTTAYLDSSNVVASGSYPRNSAALVGATYSLSNHIKYYNLSNFHFSTLTNVEYDDSIIHPNEIKLYENYPNPFNPITKIEFSIPKSEYVSLKIFDVLGNEIKTLIDEKREAGNHSVYFNAVNLSSGIYFYKLDVNNSIITKKMVLLK